MSPAIFLRVPLFPASRHKQVHHKFDIFIVAGIGKHGKMRRYTGPLSESSIRGELAIIRDLTCAHWAHLIIGHRHVDDDRIGIELTKMRHRRRSKF